VADQVVRAQNQWALVEAEVEVRLVTPCLFGGMGAEFGDRCGMDKMSETGRMVREGGHGSEGVWAVAMPVTVTLLGKEAG